MCIKIIYFTCVFFIECISFYKVALIIWIFIINNVVLFLLAILISDELLIVLLIVHLYCFILWT